MSPPGSSVHGISQARIMEWVAISFSKVSSQPRDQTCVICIGWHISLPPSHQGSPVRHYTGFKKKNLLEFTCYSVVLLSVVEQSEYMCIYHLFVTIEHWVEFPVLYSSTFSLVIYLYPVAYICQSQSPNSSHSPFPSWCLYICFLHLCQFLLCR